jgi:hypothetical protein
MNEQKQEDQPELGENGHIKGPIALLFSEKGRSMGGSSTVTSLDGKEVEFTGMHDETEYGPWRLKYLWSDAIVVGYLKDKRNRVTKAHRVVNDGPELLHSSRAIIHERFQRR